MNKLLSTLQELLAITSELTAVKITQIANHDFEKQYLLQNMLNNYYARVNKLYLIQHNLNRNMIEHSPHSYFIAENSRKLICGVICVDPSMKEITAIVEKFSLSLSALENCIEFRRLVLFDESLPPTVTAITLMASAAYWAFAQHYTGIVLLAENIQSRYFKHFGISKLTHISQRLEDRNNNYYWLMKGEGMNMLASVQRLIQLITQKKNLTKLA